MNQNLKFKTWVCVCIMSCVVDQEMFAIEKLERGQGDSIEMSGKIIQCFSEVEER